MGSTLKQINVMAADSVASDPYKVCILKARSSYSFASISEH